MMRANVKVWFLETRPQFLLLPIVLAFLGTSVAWYDTVSMPAFAAVFNPGYAVLGLVGLLLAHVAVNTINDYFDYKSGIDLAVERTPFSGGSGILPAAALTTRQVLFLSITSFIAAVAIGSYFIAIRGITLLPLLVVAAICIFLYTPAILKTHWPEWAAGLGLGFLPVLGAYFIQTSSYATSAFIAAVPAGILVYNLLLINEFPDVQADLIDHRRTLPITAGKKKAGVVYSVMTFIMYFWIVGMVASQQMPVFCLLALLTTPFAFRAISGALDPDNRGKLMPALGNNVMVVLITQLLLGVGYVLGRIFYS